MDQFFSYLDIVVDFLWGFIGAPILVFLGLYFCYRSSFVQLRRFPAIFRNFVECFSSHGDGSSQLHPIRAFFASIGGSLGIGNVVAVATAVQIGGPGTLVWIWITAIIGSLIKYAEVYIGMSRRRKLPNGGSQGGPMYFLQDAFSGAKWPTIIFCVLMCLYSVEIYQFSVVTSVTAYALHVEKWVTALIFLSIIFTIELGGFQRIGRISSILVPIVVAVYVSMGTYVLLSNISILPTVLSDIVHSAFSARAAEGGFLGSTMLLAMSHGVRRGCYSTDIGVGYASIIHSASSATNPAKQASLLIFEVFMDTFFVCSMSILLILVTGAWTTTIDPLFLVQASLAKYFPGMHIFMPFFLSLLGYSTIITYFSAGMHTAKFLMPVWGRRILYGYALAAFFTFSYLDNAHAITIMAFVGFLLLVLNAIGIWRLRHEVSFAVRSEEAPETAS